MASKNYDAKLVHERSIIQNQLNQLNQLTKLETLDRVVPQLLAGIKAVQNLKMATHTKEGATLKETFDAWIKVHEPMRELMELYPTERA